MIFYYAAIPFVTVMVLLLVFRTKPKKQPKKQLLNPRFHVWGWGTPNDKVKHPVSYRGMDDKELTDKMIQYSEAFDSGQIDNWLLTQIVLINKELDRREVARI